MTIQKQDVAIPEKINSLPVTKIGANAFYGASSLTSIELPNTLTSIGPSAFAGSGLTSITIPASMTSIGSSAFAGASSLTQIELPNTLTSIGQYAFYGSGLTSITIPASMTSIGQYAFNGASSLTQIKLPNTLTSIEWYAFAGSGLTSITIPTSMTSIGSSAFYGASSLTSIELPNTLTSIGVAAFYGSGLTSITIPASMTSIGQSTFTGASKLTSIELPNTLTSIGKYAFNGSGLTSITIPASMTRIDSLAFPELKNVTVYAYKDSSAETYATNRISDNWRFVALYDVTFKSNGGSAVSKEMVKSGTVVKEPTAPTKANHRVEGWYTDTALTIPWDFATDKVMSDTTLHAKWLPTSEVTYDSNQGSTVPKETVDTGTVATKPSNPTRANHRFESWYEDAALTKEFDFTKPVTQDLTLYAKWMYVPNVAPPVEILDLSNIGDSSTGIQGIVSPNSYIQIVLNGTELANGRADNEGRFNIEIPSLLAGTELKMIVTNRFGSKKTIFFKVVDQTPPKVTVKPFSDKDTKITGKTEPKAKVKIYINGKLVKTITADEKGNYSYTVPKKKAGTVIKVIVTDQAGNATTKTLKVVDKTAPAKPTVKTPTTNTTTLTGKAEKGSTVYVYKNNKVIAKAKVDANGKYSVKIPKQKRGTILTLIARDQAKNASKKTSIKVKKA